MRNIERIIESQYPPRQTNVAWKDVNENTLKFYVDGEWRALKDEDFRQKQADWNQADNTKEDYIKNKPTIPSGGGRNTLNVVNRIGDIETDLLVDDYANHEEFVAACIALLGITEAELNSLASGEYDFIYIPMHFAHNDAEYDIPYCGCGYEYNGSLESLKHTRTVFYCKTPYIDNGDLVYEQQIAITSEYINTDFVISELYIYNAGGDEPQP